MGVVYCSKCYRKLEVTNAQSNGNKIKCPDCGFENVIYDNYYSSNSSSENTQQQILSTLKQIKSMVSFFYVVAIISLIILVMSLIADVVMK